MFSRRPAGIRRPRSDRAARRHHRRTVPGIPRRIFTLMAILASPYTSTRRRTGRYTILTRAGRSTSSASGRGCASCARTASAGAVRAQCGTPTSSRQILRRSPNLTRSQITTRETRAARSWALMIRTIMSTSSRIRTGRLRTRRRSTSRIRTSLIRICTSTPTWITSIPTATSTESTEQCTASASNRRRVSF